MNPSYLSYASDSSFSKCEPCAENLKTTEANFYCLECANCLCICCQDHHKMIFKRHTVLDESKRRNWKKPLDSVRFRPAPNKDSFRSSRRGCEHDRPEDTSKYCLDHKKLCCSECVKNHRYGKYFALF